MQNRCYVVRAFWIDIAAEAASVEWPAGQREPTHANLNYLNTDGACLNVVTDECIARLGIATCLAEIPYLPGAGAPAKTSISGGAPLGVVLPAALVGGEPACDGVCARAGRCCCLHQKVPTKLNITCYLMQMAFAIPCISMGCQSQLVPPAPS